MHTYINKTQIVNTFNGVVLLLYTSVKNSGHFPKLCRYLIGLPAIGYPPEKIVTDIYCMCMVGLELGLRKNGFWVSKSTVTTIMRDSYG